MTRERILFVTGRLAEHALRKVVGPLAKSIGFDYEIIVLGISVAALMHVDWVRRKLIVEGQFDRVLLPGWCQGDLAPLTEGWKIPFERGPIDLHDLPEYFGRGKRLPPDLSQYRIKILAEINHAPRLDLDSLIERGMKYRHDGADIVDLGCIPGETWSGIGDAVRVLRGHGLRVSIDSFDRQEVERGVNAGAELVLSCNRGNVDWVSKLGAEVVAIPETPADLDSLSPLVEQLESNGCRYRLDPILEPIGFGFAASLARYFETRKRFPNTSMMMGIGNLTELTEVDTAGVNLVMAAICEELNIGSVLATEVIPWARTAVREFDIARRLVRHSLENRVLPKHVRAGLVMLRDLKVHEQGPDVLRELSEQIADANFRIFVEHGEIHVMNRDGYWRGSDPYELFDQFSKSGRPLDVEHAFYLGHELSKARTALTLGKQYRQDESLQWGFLTVPEQSAHDRRKK